LTTLVRSTKYIFLLKISNFYNLEARKIQLAQELNREGFPV